MRLFYAIILPDDVRKQIARVQNLLKSHIGVQGVRWEPPEKLHITVRFLGEVAPGQLEAVKAAGLAVASGISPFSLYLGGLGTFPQKRSPRVLWLGIENDVQGYEHLVRQLELELRTRGIAADRSAGNEAPEPHPHITLARAKSPEGSKAMSRSLAKNISEYTDIKAVFFVYNIVLVESELLPNGSRYSVLETFPLSAGSTAIDPSPPAAS